MAPRSMAARFTAAQIARACSGQIVRGEPHAAATAISTDTRSLRPGEAFFALVGPNHDAHDYLSDAVTKGAAILVAERLKDGWQPPEAARTRPRPESAAVVLVADTRRALLGLAAWHRRRIRAGVAAITGSYGKSTVKGMLGSILRREWQCTVAPASFNNRIGLALTLLSAAPDDDFVVLEMGTNHPGEIDELARAARPDLSVITAIGKAHLDGLGSLEGVREAKAELIPHIHPHGTLVLNADDALCLSLGGRFAGRRRAFSAVPGPTRSGLKSKVTPDVGLALTSPTSPIVRAEHICPRGTGWTFEIRGQRFRLDAGGRYNVLNAAAAVCAAISLGSPLRSAAEALLEFRLPPMRYERRNLGGVLFVLDCYNNNPFAMRAALQSFMSEPNPGSKVVVCGDMLELGSEAPGLHREVGGQLARSGVQMLATVGPFGRHVLEGWHSRALPPQSALRFDSAEEAWRPLWSLLRPGDAVLLKGSRGMRLETITERISEHLGITGKEAAA